MDNNKPNQTSSMRIFLIIPLMMLLSSVIAGLWSYNDTKVRIAEDLNEAMIHLASAKSSFLANPDTIKALRHMKETVDQPIIYKAIDLESDNALLLEGTFFQLALLDESIYKSINGNQQRVGRMSSRNSLSNQGFVSDSIVIIPQGLAQGVAIELTGYTQCGIASVFLASDQRLSSILFLLSIIMLAFMMIRKPKQGLSLNNILSMTTNEKSSYNNQKELDLQQTSVDPLTEKLSCSSSFTSTVTNTVTSNPVSETDSEESQNSTKTKKEHINISNLKLTPMQKRFMEMLLNAPDYRVGKYQLCDALWDGKDNAEESLYTLVRRTKQTLQESGIEIRCNSGESYELHINS